MNVVYSRDGARKSRLARRAERCRYLVEGRDYDLTWERAGVHRFKWIAVVHAWCLDVFGASARVVDTWGDDGDCDSKHVTGYREKCHKIHGNNRQRAREKAQLRKDSRNV